MLVENSVANVKFLDQGNQLIAEFQPIFCTKTYIKFVDGSLVEQLDIALHNDISETDKQTILNTAQVILEDENGESLTLDVSDREINVITRLFVPYAVVVQIRKVLNI